MTWKFLALATIILGWLYFFGLMRRQQIRTEILISASPETVWTVLTDFDAYGDWNPFIRSLAGAAIVGQKLVVRMHPLHSDTSRSFQATVLVADEQRELRWRGGLLLPAILEGQHSFQLEAVDMGGHTGTRFQSNENFTGILLLFFGMERYLSSFNAMNQALKERAEAVSVRDAPLAV